MKKTKAVKVPSLKPRNPIVVAALARTGGGSGAHGRSGKAQRRAENARLSCGQYDSR